MPTTEPRTVDKTSGDVFPVTIQYADRLPAGQSITSVSATAILLEDRSDASSTVLQGSPTYSGTNVTVALKGGAPGKRYRVKVTASLTTAPYQLVDTFDLAIVDE